MAWLAAPHPRPPHPTKPTLSLSLPAAYTALASAGVINAAPAMAAADVVMNRRRLGWAGWDVDTFFSCVSGMDKPPKDSTEDRAASATAWDDFAKVSIGRARLPPSWDFCDNHSPAGASHSQSGYNHRLGMFTAAWVSVMDSLRARKRESRGEADIGGSVGIHRVSPCRHRQS